MNNKKLGVTIILFAVALGTIAFQVITNYVSKSNQLNCMSAPGCQSVGSVLNYTHLVVGILFAFLSLGIYILLFNSGSTEAILQRLETEKNIKVNDERFRTVLNILNPNEQKVLGIVKEVEGISQNMITIKSGLSKAKVSLILSDFERKNMIKREANGKTYSVYLKV